MRAQPVANLSDLLERIKNSPKYMKFCSYANDIRCYQIHPDWMFFVMTEHTNLCYGYVTFTVIGIDLVLKDEKEQVLYEKQNCSTESAINLICEAIFLGLVRSGYIPTVAALLDVVLPEDA